MGNVGLLGQRCPFMVAFFRAWMLVLLTLVTVVPIYAWYRTGYFAGLHLSGLSSFFVTVALGGLGLAPVVGRLLWSRRAIVPVWWAAVGLTWGHFWFADLHATKFSAVLIAVPIAAMVALLVRGARPLHDLAAGALLGLASVFGLFVLRADNGCTGVSGAFSTTLLVTTVALYLFGPIVLAMHLVEPSRRTRALGRLRAPAETAP